MSRRVLNDGRRLELERPSIQAGAAEARIGAARLRTKDGAAGAETSGSAAADVHSALVWGTPAWFCLRTQPKHEHIAAAYLRRELEVEVYLPRIRFRRSTQKGPAWFTEALFPNYLFARFDLAACFRRVHHARGVRGIVHFSGSWPTIPERDIDALRKAIPEGEVCVLGAEVAVGDEVEISGGVFHGLRAVVTRVLPARQRVAVLLEFLGRQTSVELPGSAVIPSTISHRGLQR